jgi:succinate dehydrogenase flavin-adding protein (antitoxin of CptAB toxin-antitoxin module)
MIERHKLLNELQEEQRLREFVQKGLKLYFEKKNINESTEEQRLRQLIYELTCDVQTEQRLRKVIQNLIQEVAKTDVPTDQPHVNTGINVLEDLLRNIIPTVESGYKALTSAKEQRVSFRAHMLNAVENSLLPAEVVAGVPHGEEEVDVVELDEQDITMDIGDDEDKFIPVRDVDIEPEEEVEVEEDEFSIEGEDLTGRNFAANTWNKVEKQTLDAFESLGDEEDRDLFKDYLLTNLKLYFDKFEDELQANLSEPESPDYEQEGGTVEEPVEEPVEELPAI